MSKTSVVYARSLVDSLDGNVKKTSEIGEELAVVAEVFSGEEARNFFSNPKISTAEKEKVVEKVLENAAPEVVNLVKLVVQNNRAKEISAIADSFHEIAAREGGAATAVVESATKLKKEELEKIAASCEKMSGKKVSAKNEINESLVGGVRVRMGDTVIDLSLAGQLAKLQQAI